MKYLLGSVLLILSMVYTEAVAILVLIFTSCSPFFIAAFSIFFAGAYAIQVKWIRCGRTERPILYNNGLVNFSLIICSFMNLALQIWLFAVDWKLFFLVLVFEIVLGRDLLYCLTEILVALPVYTLYNKMFKQPVKFAPEETARYGMNDVNDDDYYLDEDKKDNSVIIPPDQAVKCPSCGYDTYKDKPFCEWCGSLI